MSYPRPGPSGRDDDDEERSWLVDYNQSERADEPPAEWFRSDDELRERIAAWQRDREWAPPYVADDLAATAAEAARAHTDAQFKSIWVANELPVGEVAPLTREDVEYERGRAGELARWVGELERVSDARAFWYRETAHTRETAERANVELTRRGRPPTDWGAGGDDRPGRVLTHDETARAVERAREAIRLMEAAQQDHAHMRALEERADGDDHGHAR